MTGFARRWGRLIALTALILAFSPWAAAQAEEFEKPSAASLTKMLVRFGALNPREDDMLNDYGMVAECKIFDYFYRDDFRWHDVQAALRKSIRQNVNVFPTGFRYDSAMRLGRYDFKNNLFRFEGDIPQTANAFTVIIPDDQMRCNGKQIKLLPLEYRFVLDQPIRLVGIPLTEDDAQKLMKRMEQKGNKERIIFTRFNLRIVYVMPLFRNKEDNGLFTGRYRQSSGQSIIRIDSRLESIDYYEDEAGTKLIYSYRP